MKMKGPNALCGVLTGLMNIDSDLHHFLRCPDCCVAYKVRKDIVPPRGARAQCRVCNGVLVVRPPRRPTIWVFTDDPAMKRGDTLNQIQRATGFEFVLLDASDRQDLAHLPSFPLPDAVLFGDMHILLEDEMLKRCCASGAGRVLVSTHENEDLTVAAEAFCGFDHQVLVPVDTTLLGIVLDDVASPST